MANVNYNIRNQVIDMSEGRLLPAIDNLYKESLRSILNFLGNTYYIDGNGNREKVRCVYGQPERIASRLNADNTMILPLISINEIETQNSDDRRRHGHVIISEKKWDPKTRRATRVVSLAPRPINITYEINIWTKYKADLDMIRSGIFTLFNPDVDLKTQFSDYSKCFITNERDLGSFVANDTEDRILQKAITVTLETYIPTPKFRITNTGRITDINFDVEIDETKPQGSPFVSTPVIVEEVNTLTLSSIIVDLTVEGDFDAGDEIVDAGNVSLDLSALDASLAVGVADSVSASLTVSGPQTDTGLVLGSVSASLSLEDLDYTAGDDVIRSLDLIEMDTSALALQLNNEAELQTVSSTFVVNDDVLSVDSNLGVNEVSTTLISESLDNGVSVSSTGLDLTLLALEYTTETGIDLGSVTLVTSAIPAVFESQVNSSSVELDTSANNLTSDSLLNMSSIGIALEVEGLFDDTPNPEDSYDIGINLSSIILVTSANDLQTDYISDYDIELITTSLEDSYDSILNFNLPLDTSTSPDF